MIHRDVAILICSRGREEVLARLLDDLCRGFVPALEAGGLTATIFVYAQGYGTTYVAGLKHRFVDAIERENFVLMEAEGPHTRIGDVVHTAVRRVHDRASYRLAMLMDDDSTYDADAVVDANLREAARTFIAHRHRAYSIKLGQARELEYGPFIYAADPIMPFKEKMMWVARPVLDEVLAVPRFRELSIGEDAVIAAVAWLGDPSTCFAVFGMATFLHLGFEEGAAGRSEDIGGGYADLMNYDPQSGLEHGKYDAALRTGVTPFHVMPHVFVPEDHPRYIFNGIRKSLADELSLRAAAG
jgi:hypothetical protein